MASRLQAIYAAMKRDAVLSRCGLYRYRLTRSWGKGPHLAWGMLNPSKADAKLDDNTVRRLIGYALHWGYAGFVVFNLNAYRLTRSAELVRLQKRGVDVVGPENDAHILEVARAHPLVVCAWGDKGALGGRAQAVVEMLRGAAVPLHYLELTKAGFPGHPLRRRGSLVPTPWTEAGALPGSRWLRSEDDLVAVFGAVEAEALCMALIGRPSQDKVEAVRRIVETGVFGGHALAARLAGVNPGTTYEWERRGWKVSRPGQGQKPRRARPEGGRERE